MEQQTTLPAKGLAMLAGKAFPAYNGLVDVVDFLNKSLSREGYIFGVSKLDDTMTITIYQTEKSSRK